MFRNSIAFFRKSSKSSHYCRGGRKQSSAFLCLSLYEAVMYRKTSVCLCRQTIGLMYTIFNTVCAMSDMNNICQFQDIWRVFMSVRTRTGRQMSLITVRNIEAISNIKNSLSSSEFLASKCDLLESDLLSIFELCLRQQ